MNVRPFIRPGTSRLIRNTGIAAGLLLLTGLAAAQDGMSLEDLEKLVAEQRIALEEAIANRESTAAQAEEVRKDLEEAVERRRKVEEELTALCEEQESLQEGTFDDCMNKDDS